MTGKDKSRSLKGKVHGVCFYYNMRATNQMEIANKAPEIAMRCVLQDDAVVAQLKHNSHQLDDVLMLEFAVIGYFPPQLCRSSEHITRQSLSHSS